MLLIDIGLRQSHQHGLALGHGNLIDFGPGQGHPSDIVLRQDDLLYLDLGHKLILFQRRITVVILSQRKVDHPNDFFLGNLNKMTLSLVTRLQWDWHTRHT
jgi:hypothetical protein